MADNILYEMTSLCKAFTTSNGKKFLERIYDVSTDDWTLVPYEFDPKAAMTLGNKNRILCSPEDVYPDDTIDVFDWYLTENYSGSGEYSKTKRSNSLHPYQVIEVKGADSAEELISMMKEGLKEEILLDNVLFTYKVDENTGIGIHCKKSQLVVSDGIIRISDSVSTLDSYRVEYPLCNYRGLKIARTVMPKRPETVCIKSPSDIVRDIIVLRATVNSINALGISKKDCRSMREFIKSMRTDDLYAQITETINCSHDKAVEYFDNFIDTLDQAFDGGSLTDRIISAALERDPSLKARCIELSGSKWQLENEQIVRQKEEELEQLERKCKKARRERDDLKLASDEILSEISELESRKAELEDLQQKSLQAIEERLNSARADVAEFISTIPFSLDALSGKEKIQRFRHGKEKFENVIDDWKGAIGSIEDELYEAGVDQDYAAAMSAYLYACYINRIPVLLAGPNGESIANAFSVGNYGKTAAELYCTGELDDASIKAVKDSEDPVVIIKEPFARNWNHAVLGLIEKPGKMYFLLCPAAEELLLEPKSILNFCMPVLTDMFIDRVPSEQFLGSKRSGSFDEYKPVTPNMLQDEAVKCIGWQTLIKNRFRSIMTDMHSLNISVSDFDDFAFVLLPVAFITGKLDEICELVRTNSNIDKGGTRFILNYLGKNDD